MSSEDDGASSSEAALSNNEHTAYNFFISKGLRNYQAAAIVGNLIQESSVIPTAVEYGGGPGRGIAQWSVNGRWETLSSFASSRGLSKWSLTAQLEFIWYELTVEGGYGYTALKNSTTLSQATIDFQTYYEICGQCDQTKRISYAQQVLASYGGVKTGSASCYSGTLSRSMPDNACVQSKYDGLWYQCDNGSWVDRWTDPADCDGIYPL